MNFEESMQQKMESMYKNNGLIPGVNNMLGTPKASLRRLGAPNKVVRKLGSKKY